MSRSRIAFFDSNIAGASGGGCYLSGPAAAILADNTFRDNITYSHGGAFYCSSPGRLTVENTTLARNSAQGDGAGFYCSSPGPLELTDVTVANNEASFNGGGAYIIGPSSGTFTNCTFVDNTAHNHEGGGMRYSGGGSVTLQETIFARNTARTNGRGGGAFFSLGGGLTADVCLFQENTVTGVISDGGGVYFTGAPPGGDFTNSTFSGNNARNRGGALYTAAPTTVTNCTFADNNAFAVGGAAIANAGPNLTIQNTILAQSTGGDNCLGPFVSNGNNIDEEGTCGLADPTDLNGVDPLLGPLQNNGGPMATHALLGGSPAIDAGQDGGVCPGIDQRGIARPLDGDGNGVAACDIGAFEFLDCNENGVDDTSEIVNAVTTDCNANGIPDNCESPDTDGDGIWDICDTCTDTDDDGFGDPGFPANTCPEDACVDDAGKSAPGVCGCGAVDVDTDGDGVFDCVDNCPGVPNTDQLDSNGDGVGDACTEVVADPVPGCGACGVGAAGMAPLMLLGLWLMKGKARRRRRTD